MKYSLVIACLALIANSPTSYGMLPVPSSPSDNATSSPEENLPENTIEHNLNENMLRFENHTHEETSNATDNVVHNVNNTFGFKHPHSTSSPTYVKPQPGYVSELNSYTTSHYPQQYAQAMKIYLSYPRGVTINFGQGNVGGGNSYYPGPGYDGSYGQENVGGSNSYYSRYVNIGNYGQKNVGFDDGYYPERDNGGGYGQENFGGGNGYYPGDGNDGSYYNLRHYNGTNSGAENVSDADSEFVPVNCSDMAVLLREREESSKQAQTYSDNITELYKLGPEENVDEIFDEATKMITASMNVERLSYHLKKYSSCP